MFKQYIYPICFALLIISCSKSSTEELTKKNITINFIHEWDGISISADNFENLQLKNQNGDLISLSQYRYILSRIKLVGANGLEINIKDYLLVDLGRNQNLTYNFEDIVLNQTYALHFTFGFSNTDNIDGIYKDLNLASFNVPNLIGGGYHYMQFDGKYTSESTKVPTGFNYHAIRAINPSNSNNIISKDTSFEVQLPNINLKKSEETIDVKVNIAEWFKNPHTWILDDLHQNLMQNFDAQILINSNGKTVFSL